MANESLPNSITVSKNCSVRDCFEVSRIKGFCKTHYHRQWEHNGNPTPKLKRRLGVGSTPTIRFWSRVAVTSDQSKCWNWLGAKLRSGYGRLYFDGKARSAHQVAFYLATGRYASAFVLHKCDNPPCCNPLHVYEGTHTKNMTDMTERRRSTFGERHPQAKLDGAAVISIRALVENGVPRRTVADDFGVSVSLVGLIAIRKRWGHI